jgi:hypothetical protein
MENQQTSGIFINTYPRGLGEVRIIFDDETSESKNITGPSSTIFYASERHSPISLCINDHYFQIDNFPQRAKFPESEGTLSCVETDNGPWIILFDFDSLGKEN